LENEYGIPTALLSSIAFAQVARGTEPLRFIFTPHPVIAMPPEALREYIEGKDPATGKPVIDEIIDALTRPVGKELLQPKSKMSGAKKQDAGEQKVFLEPNTEENYQRIFFERGWTDGLPVVLPTEKRVKKMLTGTSHSPDERVGRSASVRDVAIVAVMAGAGPEHLPVLLAVASSNQGSIMASTTPFASMLLVNGPIRKEINMNSGMGAFSPINLANSVIGRAWTLMSINWYSNDLPNTIWSSQGNHIAYNNMCVAENEERSVWRPFHVQKGFKADESVVSFFRGWSVLNSMGAAAHRSHVEEMAILLKAFPALSSAALLIMDPLVARILKEHEGFETKEDFSRCLSQNVKIAASQFWETDYINMLMGHLPLQGQEPYASWKEKPDEWITPYNNPDQINIVVVGGETSPVWKASDFGYQNSASVDKWR
jgi:hypothetical protein